MKYFVRDHGGYRFGADFNTMHDTRLSDEILSHYGVVAENIVIMSDRALPVERCQPRTAMIAEYNEPLIFVHSEMLKDPLWYAAHIVHEKVHLEQFRKDEIQMKVGSGEVIHDGVTYDEKLLVSEQAHLLPFETPAYTAQLAFMQQFRPKLTIEQLIR